MRRDKISEVRSAAAISLGKIGDASALENLLTILRGKPSEDTEFIRRSAARSIGQIAQISQTGDPTVLTPQNFLPEKFKRLGPPDRPAPGTFSPAIDVLTRVLRNHDESDDTRREAAFALGAIGDSSSRATLESFTSSPDPYMAEISREAILKIDRRQSVVPSGNSNNR
jgi:HEAT repeat protein